MSTQQNSDSWTEWSQYVRLGLTDLREKIDKLQEKYEKLNLEIAVMKMKVAMWGGVGATIATGILQLAFNIFKLKGGP